MMQVYLETLLRQDKSGKLVPWLAESYAVADDRKSMTFNLRKGVVFHDGSDFNADVAIWNLGNYIQAQLVSDWNSVDKIDDYTIRVNFPKWKNNIPSSFADASTPIFMVSQEAFKKNGTDYLRSHPVGTGPFSMENFVYGANMTVLKNPRYWKKTADGTTLPYLDGIEFSFVSEPNTAMMVMQSGGADIASITGCKLVNQYKNLGFNVDFVLPDKYALLPDTANTDSPWSKKEVREAVEYAINREGIAKAFGYGYSQAPYQIPPRTTTAYNPDFSLGRHYDLDKAKQLLASAGLAGGFKTKIICFPDPSIKDASMAIQEDLAKVNIEVQLEYPAQSAFMMYMGAGTWNNAALYLNLPAIDPTYTGGMQWIFNMYGKSWLRTPQTTQAYETALSSPETDINLVRAVTDLITQDASIIPINENAEGKVKQPYANADFFQRGQALFWNTEEAWLNR